MSFKVLTPPARINAATSSPMMPSARSKEVKADNSSAAPAAAVEMQSFRLSWRTAFRLRFLLSLYSA